MPTPRSGDTGAAANVTRSMPRTTANPAQGATAVMARTTTMQQVGSRRQPPRNNWYGIAAFMALLALIAGGFVLFNVLKNDGEANATSFPLANVVGLPLDEATKMLEDAGLAFNKIEQPTPDAVEGAVVATTPAAGEIVSTGQAIDVFYNPIKTPVPIPDVKGKTVDEATSILTGAGFTISPDTVFVVDSNIAPGQVLSTNPAFGESAKQGTLVILTVSAAPDQVSVPEVTGQSGDAAKSLLEAEPYTFKVSVTSEPSADVPANSVLRTDPAVNTPVAKGSPIALIVSAGPAKVRVPPVEGLTEAAARNQLTLKGLIANVVPVTVAPGSPQDGIVISQSIPASELVPPGTTIRLQVGKAAPAPTTTTSTTTTIPATTTTQPSADLTIAITHSSSTGSATFRITATNAGGPSAVTSASLSDNTVGAGTVTWTCTSSSGTSCGGGSTASFTVLVDLPVNGSVTFTVVATGPSATTLTNNASISTPNGVTDPGPSSNNSANDSVAIP